MEWYRGVKLVDAGPDTLNPSESDTTAWIRIGNYGAFTVFGHYQVLGVGDSLGGTIKYEIDIYDPEITYPSSFSLTAHQPYWKMGETGAMTIVTFTAALADTGYKYFDLHLPAATAPSPCNSIRFITNNSTADTFRVSNRYMFVQP
ncbi:MAG: hypothetical protein ACFE95_13505 [Candidatus Hodarchaeota archaeon]